MSRRQETSVHLRDKICRLCLEEQPKLAELENLYFDDVHFVDIIKDCFAIEILLNEDQLPLLICKKCLVKTLNFHAFKSSCIENEVFLQSVDLDELDIKQQAHSVTNQLKQTDDEDNTSDNNNVLDNLDHESKASSSSTSNADKFQNEKNTENDDKTFDLINTNHGDGIKINLSVALSENDCSLYNSDTDKSSDTTCSICNSFFVHRRKINGEACSCTRAHSEKAFKKESPEIVKTYACSACQQKFSKPGEWKAHMISHYSISKYSCLQCTESFDSKHELVVHTYTHLYKNAEENLRKKSQQK